MPFDTDLFSVHRLIRLQIIQRPAGSPSPGAQCSPIIELAWLTFVRKSNDSFRQAGAIVGLDTNRDVDGISPALRQHLLLPGWSIGGSEWREACGFASRFDRCQKF